MEARGTSITDHVTNPISGGFTSGETRTIIAVPTATTVAASNITSANFIAGYPVTFLPGFHAANGSNAHALITEPASFCDAAGGSPIVEQPEVKSLDLNKTKEAPGIKDEIQVKIYPNPNNGQFTKKMVVD